MIIVKKEYLNVKPTGYKLTLGEIGQNGLKSLSEKYPNYFEKQKVKKVKIKNDLED